MRIVADTNLLVRVIVNDDPTQAGAAAKVLMSAELIAIPSVVFCEFAWVLKRVYGRSATESLHAIESLLAVGNVVTDRLAVETGIAVQRAGGDFADGVIAFEGRRMGADTFVSFDKKAVGLLRSRGFDTRLAG